VAAGVACAEGAAVRDLLRVGRRGAGVLCAMGVTESPLRRGIVTGAGTVTNGGGDAGAVATVGPSAARHRTGAAGAGRRVASGAGAP